MSPCPVVYTIRGSVATRHDVARAYNDRVPDARRIGRSLLRIAKWVAITLAGAIALLVAWGVFIEPRFILQHEQIDATVPNLPRSWDGSRVVVVADLHVGMWFANHALARRAIRDIVEERPALVLIAGDFLYKADRDPTQLDDAADLIRPLTAAGIPTYAVLGNHDYSVNWRSDPVNDTLARRLADRLATAGVTVLRNDAVPLTAPGGVAADAPDRLFLVGLDSEWAHETNAAKALSTVPERSPRIVFMHNPWSFRALPPHAAPFAVAAHTHGGQIRIPLTPNWSWIDLVEHRRIPAGGWAWSTFGTAGNRLYVQRGIGFTTAPIRINDPPSITTFVLHGR